MDWKKYQNNNQMVIAIDGVSGSGKSSTAKVLAKKLNINYLNTGLMYRIVTYFAKQKQLKATQTTELKKLIFSLNFSFQAPYHISIHNKPFTQNLHSTEISNFVSQYAAIPLVRKLLVSIQQQMIASFHFVVEGRDISSTVCPTSKFKFFLWASDEIRSQRRVKQLKDLGINESQQNILTNIQNRDQKDSNRSCDPLTQDLDADLIDTSTITFEEQIQQILNCISQKIKCAERLISNHAY